MHLYGKPTNKQIGKAWLEKKYHSEIEESPI
jgi:hypothetical protein